MVHLAERSIHKNSNSCWRFAAPITVLKNNPNLPQQSIHLQYGFYMHSLGSTQAALEHWRKAGPAGQNLVESYSEDVH